MTKTYQLLASEHYAAFLHSSEKRSRTLVVTFCDITTGVGVRGFGTDWLLERHYDTIYVSQKRRTQFQHLSRETFFDAINPVAQDYDRVVCYGASLGGYAAFYYGGTITSSIIAASPRLSCHPDFASPYWDGFEFLHELSLPAPVTGEVPIVLFDPLELTDCRFLFQYIGPRYKHLHLSAIPGAGHLILKTMAKAGVLSKIMAKMMSGKITGVPRWARRDIQNYLASGAVPETLDAG